MIKHKTNLGLVQMLRGVASMLVVLYHTTVNSKEILNKDFCSGFFLFGGAGVDIFFVLSGFIITYTSLKGIGHPDKLLSFLKRRFVRVFPTYWIIITIFILLQLAFPGYYKTHYVFTASNLTATLFLLPGHPMVNGVSWTLSYELFFYLLFSLAFLLRNKKMALILAAVFALIIIAIPIAGYDAEHGNQWLNLITFPMNVEFFMGVLASVVIPHIPARLSLPLIISGALLFLASGIFTDQHYVLVANTFNRVLLFGVPSFLIITGLVKFELSKHVAVHNILLSLGEASYSLYLLHLPVIVACLKVIATFQISSNIIVHGLLFVVITAVCCASVLFFKWIEHPIINKLNAPRKA